MPIKSGAIHHLSMRKRIYQKHEKYPHPKKLINIFDKLIYIAIIVGPIMIFPQLFTIWYHKQATGVSLTSWISFVILNFIWLGYGILHKEKPIIYTSISAVILQTLVVVGVILYG